MPGTLGPDVPGGPQGVGRSVTMPISPKSTDSEGPLSLPSPWNLESDPKGRPDIPGGPQGVGRSVTIPISPTTPVKGGVRSGNFYRRKRSPRSHSPHWVWPRIC